LKIIGIFNKKLFQTEKHEEQRETGEDGNRDEKYCPDELLVHVLSLILVSGKFKILI
jgi:hypothetical protein